MDEYYSNVFSPEVTEVMVSPTGTCSVSLRETDAISPDDLEKASKRKIVRINTQIKKLMSIVAYLRRHWSEMYRRHRPEHQTVPRIYPQRLVGRPVQPRGNVALTDPDEVKAGLDKLWTEYTARHRAAPNYTCCDIVRHGDYDGCEKAYIRIEAPS